MREEIIKYLRHVGDDFDPKDESVDTSPECEGQEGQKEDEEGYGFCPDHKDCGICRYEYMKRKGWLSEEVNTKGWVRVIDVNREPPRPGYWLCPLCKKLKKLT